MERKYIISVLFSNILLFSSCLSDFEEQDLTLSTHNIDFGETKSEEIITIYYNSSNEVSFSADVDLMENNWVQIGSKTGKFVSSYDLPIRIDRNIMPEGDASAKVNVKIGNVIKSIYITASHPSEFEITPSLNFEPGIDNLDLIIKSRIGGKTVVLSKECDWIELSKDTLDIPRYNENKSEETTVVVNVKAIKDNLGVGEYSTNINVKELGGNFEQTIPVTLIKDGNEYLQKTVDGIQFTLNDFQVVGDLIRVNFTFKNISSKTISFLPKFICAYDYWGNYGKIDLNRISIEGGTSYSFMNSQLSKPLTIAGGKTGTGSFDISGINGETPTLQYLEIASNLSSPFIYRDIILPGKEAKQPLVIDNPQYENDGLKIQIIEAIESGDETVVSFALTSDKYISDVTLNLDDIVAKDNNDITYKAINSSLIKSLYSKEISLSIPDDVYVTGTLSFPSIEPISSSIKKITCAYLKNNEQKKLVLNDLNLLQKENTPSVYNKIASFDYFDIYLVGCYEVADDIVLDCIIKNIKNSSRKFGFSRSYSYVIDDVGDVNQITSTSFTNGKGSDSFPEVEIEENCASRCILRIPNVDPDASGLQYVLLSCNVNGEISNKADFIISSRIEIEGRSVYSLPSIKVLYSVSKMPDKVKMELINIQHKEGYITVYFRLINLSSGLQKIKWDLYSTDSYAIDKQLKKHYITEATIGNKSVNHSYLSFDLPGNVMVRGHFDIPDIDRSTKFLDKMLLYYYDKNCYEFTDISW